MNRTLRVGIGAVRRRINNLPPLQDGTFFDVNTTVNFGYPYFVVDQPVLAGSGCWLAFELWNK